MLSILLLFTVLSVIGIIFYISKRKFSYWKKRNVPYMKPVPFYGNYYGYIMQKEYIGHSAQKICKTFPKEPIIGTYYGTEPALLIQDPELIKLILTKDFYYFNSREVAKYTDKESLTQNLFFTHGDRWKVLRQNLTPLFSSLKMRNMFVLIEKCTRIFEDLLDEETKDSNVIETRALFAKYSMSCIGTCAFGIDTKTMAKSGDNAFRRIADVVMDVSNSRAIRLTARAIWPSIFYGLRFRVYPTTIDDFFSELLTAIFQERDYKPTARNDFIDLLLKLKTNSHITGDRLSNPGQKMEIEVDDDLLVGQCVLFFAAGFDTSSTAIGFTLFEIAKNPRVQERVLEAVDKYMQLHNNVMKYECVADTPYLEACVDEALRLYPVFGVLTREVVDNYTLPNGLKLEKGLRIHIPLYHLHMHEEYFPNPKEFRPERFLGEEKRKITPYTYMPFGEGPRICIAMRFAKMEVIAGLITLLKKYRVELADDMTTEVEFKSSAMVTQPVGGIRLKFIEREGWEQRLLRDPTTKL